MTVFGPPRRGFSTVQNGALQMPHSPEVRVSPKIPVAVAIKATSIVEHTPW